MRRIVLSFPLAVATFLMGVAIGSFAGVPWFDEWTAASVPAVVTEETLPSKIEVPYPSHCDEKQEIEEVYSVILDGVRYKTEPVVLDEFTNRGGALMDARIADHALDGVDAATLANYEAQNRQPESLRKLLADRKDVIFFTEKDDKALSRKRNTPFEEKFSKRFPGSHQLVSLSSVGFNSDSTQALVYVSYYCGSLCAGGSFSVLQKVRGRWVVDHEIRMWIS